VILTWVVNICFRASLTITVKKFKSAGFSGQTPWLIQCQVFDNAWALLYITIAFHQALPVMVSWLMAIYQQTISQWSLFIYYYIYTNKHWYYMAYLVKLFLEFIQHTSKGCVKLTWCFAIQVIFYIVVKLASHEGSPKYRKQ
jgi:hypothetical protein